MIENLPTTPMKNIPDAVEIKDPNKLSLSFGQQLVGLTFNPSGDAKVNKAKQLCAELADLICDANNSPYGETGTLKKLLTEHAVCEILNAQMNVVKVLTLKY